MSQPNIAVITGDWSFGVKPLQPGGCGWYRAALPTKQLIGRGWAAALGLPAFNHDGFGVIQDSGGAIHGFDLVLIKILMHRDMVVAMQHAKKAGQTLVVDIDDFYPGLVESNQAYHFTDPSKSKNVNRDFYYQVIDLADHLTVATQGLYDYYSRSHPSVHLIRNGIDFERWKPKKVRDRKPTIGWVGGIPWRSNDIETTSNWLPGLLKDNDLMFHHSGHIQGHKNFWDLAGIDINRVTVSPMMVILDYPQMFDNIDIGIVPLNDIEFNTLGKSALKGMEYAASGIPFVAFATPEYERLAQLGVGRVARTDQEWSTHMTELLDFETRKREVKKNYKNLIKAHSMTQRGQEWHSFLSSLYSSGFVAKRRSMKDEQAVARYCEELPQGISSNNIEFISG
jgi:hypothetical protein